jgi:hypothetical protein
MIGVNRDRNEQYTQFQILAQSGHSRRAEQMSAFEG